MIRIKVIRPRRLWESCIFYPGLGKNVSLWLVCGNTGEKPRALSYLISQKHESEEISKSAWLCPLVLEIHRSGWQRDMAPQMRFVILMCVYVWWGVLYLSLFLNVKACVCVGGGCS